MPASSLQIRLLVFRFLLRSGAGYVRNILANVIKRALGREPYFDKSEIVFHAWARYRLGLQPKPRFTSRSLPGEGAGSQIRLTMCAINFARAFGFTYEHTPFSEIAHAEQPIALWARAWEDEFNLGDGEIAASGPGDNVLDFARMYSGIASRFGYRETFELFNESAPSFRAKYFRNKIRRKSSTLMIAVHVRRGDVASKENRGRWAEWDQVLNSVTQLKHALEQRALSYKIRIFSDGGASEFDGAEALGCELCVKRDALWTMRAMIEADVLVMGRGYFSYVAAIVSEGIKLFDPWGHIPPLDGWIVRDANGHFSGSAFGRALDKKIAAQMAACQPP